MIYMVAFADGRIYDTTPSQRALSSEVETPLDFTLRELPPLTTIGVLVWAACQNNEDVHGVGYCRVQ
jgi:hypothetical protein